MPTPPYGTWPHADPYLQWAQDSHFVDHGGAPAWLPVSVELHRGTIVDALKKALGAEAKINHASGALPFVTCHVSAAGLQLLKASHLVLRYELALPFQVGRPRNRVGGKARIGPPIKDPNPTTNDSPVLTAILDAGCPFAHRRLRYLANGGTRVRAIWDQDSDPDFQGLGTAPAGLSYGLQVDRPALNAAIGSAMRGGSVDERLCYEIAGYGDMRVSRSHGAHCLGWFVGNQPLTGEDDAQNSDVLFVQFPRDVLDVPSNGAMSMHVLDGIAWVLSQRRTHETKVVVNVSYLSPLGPHDGASIFEQCLDAMIASAAKLGVALQVFLAMGNEYRRRVHGLVPKLQCDGPCPFGIRLFPASEVPTFVEIWAPDDAPDLVVSVTPPGAIFPVMTTLPDAYTVWPNATNPACALYRSRWAGHKATLTLLRLAPTRNVDSGAVAAVGDWRIELSSKQGVPTPIHAYISLARGSLNTINRGVQAQFSPAVSGLVDITSKAGTISGMCCGSAAAVVGAVNAWATAGKPYPSYADYCSDGPSRNSVYGHPHHYAPSEQTPSLSGMLGMGNRSGKVFRMSGTSVAAPQVARYAVNSAVTLPHTPVPNRLVIP